MPATETEQLVVQLEARITDFEKNFRRANRAANDNWTKIEGRGRQAGRRMQADMNTATNGIVANFARIGKAGTILSGGLIGLAGGLAIERILSTVIKTIGDVAKIADVAEQVGMTAEQVQELRYALTQSGGEVETADTGMQRFVKSLGDAAMGTGNLGKILKANGVALRDQNGAMRSSGEMLSEVANLIQNARSAQEKMTIANEAFGRSAGPAFVQALSGGAAGLAKFAGEARQAGIITNDMAAKAAELDDKWSALMTKFKAESANAIIGAADRLDKFIANVAEWLTWVDAWAAKVLPILKAINQFNPISAPFDALVADPLSKGVNTPSAPTQITVHPAKRTAPTVLPTVGGGNSTGDFERATKAAQKHIEQLRLEAAIVGATTYERERAEMALRLETAAKEANAEAGRKDTSITAAQRQQIEALADAYGQAAVAAEQAKDRQAELKEGLREFGSAMADSFKGAVLEGQTLDQIVQSLIKRLASKAIDKAFDALFSGGTSGTGLFGWLLGLKDGGPVRALADGGYVRGPGSSRSDSIPARLSDGEFVVNAKATAKHRQVLQAINNGTIARFANGGPVGRAAQTFAPVQSTSVVQNVSVQVQGSAGTPEQNNDLADKIVRQIEPLARELVGKELRTQMKPGGMLNR